MKAETLKKSILQYAMQGKLIPQNPNDEPASELLKRIKAEKEQLIKDGKIKKEKPLPPITEDEIPFKIPSSWVWCRVNDIGVYKKGPFGSALTKKIFVPKGNDTVKVYEQKNAIQKDYTLGEYYISKEYYEKSMKGFTVSSGDIIVSCAGTIGETYVMPENIELGIINQALMRMTITKEIDLKYFLMYFDIILKRDSKTYSKGSAIKNIPPFEIFKPMLVPLPPLAEQQRIVEKLEEILPLLEEYGKNEEILSEMNEKLPKQIRQSILQYAVQGKLVPQNPNDEPASELLKRIKAEKEQLTKDGKIKKEQPLPPITEDEIPYELPQGWEWVKLGEICLKIVDGDHNPPSGHPVKTNYLMLSASNINYDKIVDLDKVRYLTKETFDEENKRTNLHVNDILFTIVGTLGRSCIYDGNLNICFQRSVSVLTTLIYNKYLKIVLDSPYIQSFMQKNATGTAQKGFYLNQVSNLIIPLPPFAEQQRIVTKVEELMQIADKLEDNI